MLSNLRSTTDRLKQSIIPRLQRLTRQSQRRYYREFWALKDISFEVKKGETVGIIGRNSCGKSTLLQIICGTLAPSNDDVETNGRVAALLELGAGFNYDFTGRENVYINGAVLGLCKEEIDARFNNIAALADIGDFIDQPVTTYSSGMFARLAFAVAANVDPEILIVDEILSVTFPKLPLLQGNYVWRIAINDDGGLLVHTEAEGVCPFRVVDDFKSVGMFELQREWDIVIEQIKNINPRGHATTVVDECY